MRNTIIGCAVAALVMGSAAVPAFADDLVIGGPSYDDGYYQGHHRDRAGVIISDRGISVGRVHRDRYYDRDRCYTKTITRMNEDGDRITRTIRRCD
ncbi:hypothetical protein [Rhizobium leucaenae]|jgi:hypothetical protein|uniref:Uncharacterized protein n=1 Tax=Rhizobium leucaenae TaxID=29450 RepID=A0A7W6ZU04_9HYPH|nr:hypothetical protein [Rhizobium leucaenae]MBB4568734.1 hypothetical protein [Rhizobium leucaenae]MBB6302188.1 hypothetical protein [Rhizobium leucaenae]